MTEPSAEHAIVDCAADLEQQIGAISRPSHLLRLVHTAVDQEIRCAFGDRRPDLLTGLEPFRLFNKQRSLASECLSENIMSGRAQVLDGFLASQC
jgi:hypothetical protein